MVESIYLSWLWFILFVRSSQLYDNQTVYDYTEMYIGLFMVIIVLCPIWGWSLFIYNLFVVNNTVEKLFHLKTIISLIFLQCFPHVHLYAAACHNINTDDHILTFFSSLYVKWVRDQILLLSYAASVFLSLTHTHSELTSLPVSTCHRSSWRINSSDKLFETCKEPS